MKSDVLSHEEFLARLRAIGEQRYHDKHIVHRRMNDGVLNPDQIGGRFWVNLNAHILKVFSLCSFRTPHETLRRQR